MTTVSAGSMACNDKFILNVKKMVKDCRRINKCIASKILYHILVQQTTIIQCFASGWLTKLQFNQQNKHTTMTDKLTKQIQRTKSSLTNVSKYWLRKRRPGPIKDVSSIPISVLDM